MAWLLKWIHYHPGHTGASCLPEATGNKQITYNLILLPVPKVGGRSWWRRGWGWGTPRESCGPCPSLEEGSQEWCTVTWTWKDCLQVSTRLSGRGEQWLILQDPVF